jgi:hypothetical protein
MRCTVISISNPLDLSTREVFEVNSGATVRSVIESRGSGCWRAFLHGQELKEDELDLELNSGDVLGVVDMPQGPLLAALPYLIIAFVSGYIAYRLLTRTKPDPRGDQGSPTYAFGGIGNNRNEGLPIPIVYGRHRTGGTMISESGSLSGSNNMTVNQLIAVSEGPIYGIGSLESQLINNTQSSGSVYGENIPLGITIDESEASNLAEAQIDVRPGGNVQLPIPGFNVISIETPYAIKLNSEETTSSDNSALMFGEGDWNDAAKYADVDAKFDTYATTFRLDDKDYDSFTTRIEMPAGLVRLDNNGNHFNSILQVAVRYRKLDSSGLPVLSGGPGGDGWLYESFPPVLQAATRQRIFREYSFALKDPSSSSGGISVGASFSPGTTSTNGELIASFPPSQNFRVFWTEGDLPVPQFWAESPGSNWLGWMLYCNDIGLDPMNSFVIGGVFKVDVARLSDPQFPRVAVLARLGNGGDQGAEIRAVCDAGSTDLRIEAKVANSYTGDFSVVLSHTIPGYSGEWFKAEFRYRMTDKNGYPYPGWNGGVNWQYRPMGHRHSLYVNGSELDYRQYTAPYNEFDDTYGFWPIARRPEGAARVLYAKTLDAVYIDELYYGETGLALETEYSGTTAYINSTTSPFQPSIEDTGTTSIVNRAADFPHAVAYLFDANTGSGPVSYASGRSLGDYGQDMQLQQGNGTIGVEPGYTFSAGSGGSLTPGRYEAQIVRVNKDSTNDKCIDDANLAAVIGIENKGLGYPGVALIGAKVRATDQLRDTKPNFTAVVWGRLVPVLLGEAPNYIYSSNPAWIALDILLDKRVGLGHRYSVKNIDRQSIADWATYCDEIVYAGSAQFSMNNAGYATSTDWDDIAFYNDTATVSGLVRGSLEVYIKQVSSQDVAPYSVGSYVRLHGFPDPDNYPNSVDNDINQGPAGSSVAGGYEVKEVIEDPSNSERWKITLWWDRTTEDDPWLSGSLLSSRLPLDGGDQDDLNGAILEIGEARHSFNAVFDKEYNAWDALVQVCSVGRAKPIMTGNTVRFAIDRARDPIGMIGMASIKANSFEMSYAGPKSRPNSYEMVIFPEDANWERATEIINDPELADPTQFDQFRRESVQLVGVTSRGQARREGIFRIKSNKLRLRTGRMICGPEAMGFEPGDVVYISHDIMLRGVSGRILSINSPSSARQQFEIDRDVTIESGKTYLVYVRDPATGIIENSQISTIDATPIAPGDYSAGATIRLTDALSFDVQPGITTWSLAASGEEMQVEITSIKMGENLEHEIEWLEYRSEVYDDGITEVLPEVNALDGAGSGTQGGLGGSVLAATEVSVLETNQRNSGESFIPSFEVSWKFNADQGRWIKGWRVLQRSSTPEYAGQVGLEDRYSDWKVVAQGQGVGTHATIPADNCIPGRDVEFRVYLYGDRPSTPPDYCRGARVKYRGVGPTPAAPTSAAMRFNEERALYYARQSDDHYREQIEWRRGGWILGDPIGRLTPGDPALGPTDNWAGAVTGDTNLYASTVTSMGQYSAPMLVQQAPSPRLDEIAFDATWQSQAWEDYEDGWKTDGLPPAYDPQLSGLQRHADGYLEFTGTGLTGTYMTANELIPAPRAEQMIRPVRVFLQTYWEAEQVHPGTWLWAEELEWRSTSAEQWTWEGPLSNGIYTDNNCVVECEARFSEDGVTWGDWLPFTPGLYALTAVQFRLKATRSNASFNVKIHKFHTVISQRFRTITDRDRMTAFVERDIL